MFPHGERRLIIDRLSLDLRAGEFLTIVGSSGTGKSTLLRLLGGLVPATSGTIRFRGNAVTGAPAGVVVVFQDYSNALLQWRSIARNVALGIESKLDKAEIDGGYGNRCRWSGLNAMRWIIPGSSPVACSSGCRLPARWRLSPT